MADRRDVTYEKVGRIAKVQLHRPQYHNAQSLGLLKELDAALQEAGEDRTVKVIVLSGVGESFSSGHDLGTPEHREALRGFGTGRSAVEANFEYSARYFLDFALRWRDLPKPTLAQVQGWCLFGGWILAASMDLIVASDDTRFMTGFLQYFSLPYDIGIRQAKELLFDPRELSAAEARELGFVSKVVPRAELEAATLEFAERIARRPLFYLRLAKLAANGVQDAGGFRTAVTAANAQQMLTYLDELDRDGKLGAGAGAGAGAAKARPPREHRRPIVDDILARPTDVR